MSIDCTHNPLPFVLYLYLTQTSPSATFLRSTHVASKTAIYDMAMDSDEKKFYVSGPDKLLRWVSSVFVGCFLCLLLGCFHVCCWVSVVRVFSRFLGCYLCLLLGCFLCLLLGCLQSQVVRSCWPSRPLLEMREVCWKWPLTPQGTMQPLVVRTRPF